jgi:predicted acetyltransferase
VNRSRDRYGRQVPELIPPTMRLATWALGRRLDEARAIGLDRVLLVCEAGNVASARTIERAGGVLDDERPTDLGAVRRYWIEVSSR